MKILAIETSCDETAIALVEARGSLNNPHFKILENLVASQIKIHRPYGGVVPNLAKREHLRNLPILFRKVFNIRTSDVQRLKSVDLIAVTVGPGLEPALWTGINFAKEIYKEIRKLGNKEIKLIGVSHLDGHLYSNWLRQSYESYEAKPRKIEFPVVALIVSGGHTTLLLMKDIIHYKKLGETRDDAAGECFDKVARLLRLPYPGGPEIEKLAKIGDSCAINFPRPMLNQKNYDFSFSGLKTSVLYYLRDHEPKTKSYKLKTDIAASFQAASFDVLISKTLKAAKEFSAKSIILSGGVASNFSLRKNLKLRIKNEELRIEAILPAKKFCTDNAAMIAVAGYFNHLQAKKYALKARGNLSI